MLPALSTPNAAALPPRLPTCLSLYRHSETPRDFAQDTHDVFKKQNSDAPQELGPSEASSSAVVTTTTVIGRAKTNSERGKEFRAKRKKYEGELETAVYKLRNHIAQLDVEKALWEKQFLDARHTQAGSLVRLIQQYFSLFRFGLRDPAMQPSDAVIGGKRALMPSPDCDLAALEKIRRQKEFLAHTMDTDAIVGDKNGPSASLAQWRMYTVSHDSLRNEPYHIATSGTEDQPCVEVHTNIHGRITRDTIRYMFPGALDNEKLIQKFLRRDVVYKSVFRFHFTDFDRIAIETADISIVEGLQDAGFALDDITQLMQMTVLTPHCTIPEAGESAPRMAPPPALQETRQGSPTSTKLSLEFLLATEDDDRVHEIVS
jgi:hypothetical protein